MAKSYRQALEEARQTQAAQTAPAPAASQATFMDIAAPQAGAVVSMLPSGERGAITGNMPTLPAQEPLSSPSPPERAAPVTDFGKVVSSDPLTLDMQAGLPTAQPGWYDDPINASRAILDGMVFGFSDEVGAGVAAALAHLTAPAPKDPETGKELKGGWTQYKAIYRDMMGQLQNERNIYTANNPKASLLLNLGGGMLSPLNKPIAWLGGKTVGAAKSAIGTAGDKLATLIGRPELTRTQRALSAMERRAGTTTARLAPALQTVPQAGLASRVGTAIAEAAPASILGGALYSAGTAAPGAPIGGAAFEGATMGAAFSPVAGVVPLFRSLVTKRRVAQELGKGEDFVPLTLAADKANPVLGWVYRNLVGRAFIGAGMLDNQASRWYTPMFRRIDGFKGRLSAADSTIRSLTARINQSVAEEFKTTKQLIQATAKVNAQQIRNDFKQKIADLRNQAATAEAATTLIPQVFRSQAMHAALPDNFPEASKKAIFEAMELGEYRKANALLRSAWNEHGFNMLNNGTFKIGNVSERTIMGEAPLLGGKRPTTTVREVDLSPVLDRLEKALDVEDLAALSVPGNKLEYVRNEAERFLRELVDAEGNIKGSSLATLRNMISGMVKPARMAGTQSAIDADLRSVWLELKNVLDGVVKAQMSPAERAAFANHQAAYRPRLAIDEAITSTSRGGGAFEPADWMGAVKRRFRKDWGVDNAPLQREAEKARDIGVSADAAVVAAAERAKLIQAQQILTENNNMRAAVQAQLVKARDEIARIEARIPKEVDKRLFLAQHSGAVAGRSAITALEQQLENLSAQRDTVIGLLPKNGGDLTAAQSWTATLLLSAPMAAIGGGAGFSILGGAATAPLAALQGTQRFLAGQTQWQKYLDDVLASRRSAGAVGAAIAAGESVSTNRKDIAAIENASPARKRAILSSLEASGRLADFQRKQPEVYQMLLKEMQK